MKGVVLVLVAIMEAITEGVTAEATGEVTSREWPNSVQYPPLAAADGMG